LIGTMIDLSGNPQQETIISYLATHFPENGKRKPELVPGSTSISFQEWVVPTLGQRSRDPVQAPDGSIWWAGQWGNLIGRIDPKTGDMKEYPLPENAMPHSVTIDAQGNVWYTGNKNGTVGKLDPHTGAITEYKMPDPAAKDPHTAIFDRQGVMWFTLQLSNMVGRLHPDTGDIKLVTMPTPQSRPYGIVLDARGVPWVPATAATAWSRSTPRRWCCASTNCRMRRPPCGVSTLPAMACSGTSIPPRVGSAGSTRTRARVKNGLLPADLNRTPMPSRW
jgi:virginiamycin B lyase